MTTLYLLMAEKLAGHWRARANTYPQKFLLTPAQRAEYYESRHLYGANPETGDDIKHMGVPIEISEGTPGVMVAADGMEVPLQG